MPRTARALTGGICSHLLNRGNGRADVFHGQEGYAAFAGLMRRACERVAMRVVAWWLMPNRFHLVVWPCEDGELARRMQWLLTSHVRRHHRRQGRRTGRGRRWAGAASGNLARDSCILADAAGHGSEGGTWRSSLSSLSFFARTDTDRIGLVTFGVCGRE